MKALVKLKAEPGIWMQDVPMPVVGDNDVLIKDKHICIRILYFRVNFNLSLYYRCVLK